jgi:hypothetical protein
MDFKIEFTDKEITPWGGLALMKQMLEKAGIKEILKEIPLPEQGSNRGYDPLQLIIMFWISVWCGASRFEHLEVSRQDEVIRQLYGWNRMPGHKAFERYFKKFDQAKNQRVFNPLFEWFFKEIRFDNYTLDFDSTVMTRYGDQEGASKGYNPQKRGRKSQHPLMAFVADCRMVANFWLRQGSAYTTNNFFAFFEETLLRLGGKKIGLVRADSGFYDKAIFEYLENPDRSINYIIAARMYQPVKWALASEKVWLKLDEGIEIAETMYQSPLWDKPRRMIMVRQQIEKRPKASGKKLRLFDDEGIFKNYRYSCFITNLDLPAKMVWDLYRGRADAENRIKELKYDFSADNFNMHNFFATEAALNFVMMAYNLMSLFRQVILNTKVHQTLKTLRYKIFSIGGYWVKDGNTKILKLSLAMKRREWFKGLWNASCLFEWPVTIPT